jgi:signal transduction histidine kinase/DNA-binding response OmpR family regulator
MSDRQMTADSPGLLRFRLAMQRTRLWVYVVGWLLAFLFKYLGALDIRYGHSIIALPGIGSALLFMALYKRGVTWARNWQWEVIDIALITWGVGISGGINSPWYIWYLTIAGAAAFVSGRRGALWVCVGNTAAYLGLLIALGDIGGADKQLFLALVRMAFLNGAAFFFLRGIADLQTQRQANKRLKENETRKVAELTRLTAVLEQRTRELETASVKIIEADRLKSQFLANMSHELRTPLNSIIGFSEILISRLEQTLAPKQLKFLGNIHDSGQHLLGIINDILDLSKIEAGKMEMNPELFPLRPVVDGVAMVMRGVAGKRDIHFDLQIPEGLPPLEADPAKFKQVLYNLLANAVKFSPDATTITVRAARVAADGASPASDQLRLSVIDQGIGIDPKDHELIFEEFRQADGSSTRPFTGTGLGLALVRKFVELHQGTITVESAQGQGSTFTVTLPFRYRGRSGEALPPLPVFSSDDLRPRILVVEDDPTAYEKISLDLLAAAYLPVRARNGEEACRLAAAIRPAAITLDLVLPGLDGWEVLKSLKADPETRAIPVIIISMMDNRELGLTLGADDYFLKPVDRDQLISRLRQMAPPAPAAEHHILLVDDDPDVHDLLGEMLEPLGYRLDHAYSGREGMELAARRLPALVILDLMMREMNGFETAARLKADPKTAHLPILVLTAKDLTQGDRDRLRDHIAALVHKGDGGPMQLVNVIQSLLRRQGPPPEVSHAAV